MTAARGAAEVTSFKEQVSNAECASTYACHGPGDLDWSGRERRGLEIPKVQISNAKQSSNLEVSKLVFLT
jgi:hypothetical protein